MPTAATPIPSKSRIESGGMFSEPTAPLRPVGSGFSLGAVRIVGSRCHRCRQRKWASGRETTRSLARSNKSSSIQAASSAGRVTIRISCALGTRAGRPRSPGWGPNLRIRGAPSQVAHRPSSPPRQLARAVRPHARSPRQPPPPPVRSVIRRAPGLPPSSWWDYPAARRSISRRTRSLIFEEVATTSRRKSRGFLGPARGSSRPMPRQLPQGERRKRFRIAGRGSRVLDGKHGGNSR